MNSSDPEIEVAKQQISEAWKVIRQRCRELYDREPFSFTVYDTGEVKIHLPSEEI